MGEEKGRVERWRGGVGFGIVWVGVSPSVSHESHAMLRFHLPLIEPDRQISRIRLSDGLHRQTHDHALRRSLRLTVKSLPGRSVSFVLLGRSQSQCLCPFHQRARSEAPSLRRHYPVSTLLRASPPPMRPDLALAGCPLRLPPLSPSVSRA